MKQTSEKIMRRIFPMSPKNFFFSCFLKESYFSQFYRKKMEYNFEIAHEIEGDILKYSNDVELSKMYSDLFDFIVDKESEGYPVFYIVHYQSNQIGAFIYNRNEYLKTRIHNGGLVFFGYKPDIRNFKVSIPKPSNKELEYVKKQLDGMAKDDYTQKGFDKMIDYAIEFCLYEGMDELLQDDEVTMNNVIKEQNKNLSYQEDWLSKSKNLTDFHIVINKVLRDEFKTMNNRFIDYWSVFYPKFISYNNAFATKTTIPTEFKRFILYHEIAHFMTGDTGYYKPIVRKGMLSFIKEREEKYPYLLLWNSLDLTYLQRKELSVDLFTFYYFEIIKNNKDKTVSWIDAISCFEYISDTNGIDIMESSKTHPSLFIRYTQCFIFWAEKYFITFLKEKFKSDNERAEFFQNPDNFLTHITKEIHTDLMHPKKGILKRVWNLSYDWYIGVLIYVMFVITRKSPQKELLDKLLKPTFSREGWSNDIVSKKQYETQEKLEIKHYTHDFFVIANLTIKEAGAFIIGEEEFNKGVINMFIKELKEYLGLTLIRHLPKSKVGDFQIILQKGDFDLVVEFMMKNIDKYAN